MSRKSLSFMTRSDNRELVRVSDAGRALLEAASADKGGW